MKILFSNILLNFNYMFILFLLNYLTYYFLLPMVEKLLFFAQILRFDIEILMHLHVLRPSESENDIFRCWSGCVSVCMWLHQHNSKANYSRNCTFGILHLYHIYMLLEIFYEDRTFANKNTQYNSHTLYPKDRISC